MTYTNTLEYNWINVFKNPKIKIIDRNIFLENESLVFDSYLTVPAMAVAGFKLRNAFNHFVFMDVLEVDNFRSLRGGDPNSDFPKNNSF